MITTIQAPQINLNGQDGMVLLREYNAAMVAVEAAGAALAQLDVHGRDYQTLGDGAYLLAREQHHERIRAIKTVSDDLLAIALSIFNQIEKVN
jgi:hypothetical protein